MVPIIMSGLFSVKTVVRGFVLADQFTDNMPSDESKNDTDAKEVKACQIDDGRVMTSHCH